MNQDLYLIFPKDNSFYINVLHRMILLLKEIIFYDIHVRILIFFELVMLEIVIGSLF